MPFCINCGKELIDGAKFCFECGSPVRKSNKNENIGKIITCPSCGENIHSFTAFCPSCGREFREINSTNSVKEFFENYVSTKETEKEAVVRAFPIPNAKEDVYEFLVQAISELKTSNNYELKCAWYSKLEQVYQKSKLIFKKDSSEMIDITGKYNEIVNTIGKDINKEKKYRNIDGLFSKIIDFFSGIQDIIPNLILVTIWLVTLFIIIPLCKIESDFEVLFLFDLIFGAIFLPFALRCYSNTPRILTILSLFLTIVILIITNDEVEVILLFDFIFSIIIFCRMFIKRSDKVQYIDKKAAVVAVFIIVSFLLMIYGVVVLGVSTIG